MQRRRQDIPHWMSRFVHNLSFFLRFKALRNSLTICWGNWIVLECKKTKQNKKKLTREWQKYSPSPSRKYKETNKISDPCSSVEAQRIQLDKEKFHFHLPEQLQSSKAYKAGITSGEKKQTTKTKRTNQKGATCGFYQHKRISAEPGRSDNWRHRKPLSGGAVSLNVEEQIKYIILSFTPFSRCRRDSEGGKKRDEERRAYWKVFVAADGALASNGVQPAAQSRNCLPTPFSPKTGCNCDEWNSEKRTQTLLWNAGRWSRQRWMGRRNHTRWRTGQVLSFSVFSAQADFRQE